MSAAKSPGSQALRPGAAGSAPPRLLHHGSGLEWGNRMPQFVVDALDPQGKKVRLSVDASTPGDAQKRLDSKGYKTLAVTLQDGAAAEPAAAPKPGILQKRVFGGRVTKKQLAQFTHQLAVLIEAGLPIVRSLKILSGQMRPCKLKEIVAQVAEDVEGGSNLSDALAKHPRTFDKLFVHMVRAGEAGGVLDEILRRLAIFMEKAQQLRRRIVSASTYPAIVLVVSIAVVLFIMTFIVPRFEQVFRQIGTGLPTLTLMVKAVSDFLVGYWYIALLIPLSIVVPLVAWSRTAGGRAVLDRWKLKAPLFGQIVRKAAVARFARSLGTLLKSGVPILDAITIVKEATGNVTVAESIGKIYDNIREGESVSEPMGASPVFDEMVVHMVSVGEETGKLDAMLLKIADVYEEEVDTAIATFVSILEPLMIVLLGFTVGLIVIALFLPMVGLLRGLRDQQMRG